MLFIIVFFQFETECPYLCHFVVFNSVIKFNVYSFEIYLLFTCNNLVNGERVFLCFQLFYLCPRGRVVKGD